MELEKILGLLETTDKLYLRLGEDPSLDRRIYQIYQIHQREIESLKRYRDYYNRKF